MKTKRLEFLTRKLAHCAKWKNGPELAPMYAAMMLKELDRIAETN